MLSNAWYSHWNFKYSHHIETLYLLLEVNSEALRSQAKIASLMEETVHATPRTTGTAIHRAADLGYVTLLTADELPKSARLGEAGNDYRVKYPFPTDLFHHQIRAWLELKTRVFIKTMAKASSYHKGELPKDADLPKGVEWDFVAYSANLLRSGRSY